MLASRFRFIAVVTLVAMIIWVYAEGEGLQTAALSPVTIHLEVGSDSDRAVWVEPSGGRTLQVEISVVGPNAAIDGLRDALRNPVRLAAGVELPGASGLHRVPLRETLRASRVFRNQPVTIESVEPAEVLVRVDDLITQTLPVRVDRVTAAGLAANPEPERADVAVRFPRSMGPLPDGSVATARLLLDDAARARLTPGRRERMPDVRIDPPPELAGRPFVTVDPAVMAVTIVLADQRAEYIVPTVYVYLQAPPRVFRDWDAQIEGDAFVRDVRVTGPAAMIDDIRSGRVLVRAYVELDENSLTEGVRTLVARPADLPTPLDFQAQDWQVQVRLSRRERSGGSGAPGDPAPPEGG